MKHKIVKFATDVKEHNLPTPSRNSIPDWYKNSPLYETGTNNVLKQSGFYHTVKRCIPFLDSLTTGYTYELWCDILVKKNINNVSEIEYRTARPPVELRAIHSSLLLPVPAGHSVQRFAWKIPYYALTPRGYSCFITHPLNRFDLPFTSLSGIVDTDDVMYAGDIPFFLREDFEGVIPKGTPILQVIPFKRDNWKQENDESIIEKGRLNNLKSFSYLHGWYKRNVWQKKEFN